MATFNLAADAVNIISQKPTFMAVKQSQLANLGFIQKQRQQSILKYIQDNAEKGGRWLDAYARVFDIDPDTLRNEIYEWDIGNPETYERLIKEGGDIRHTVNEVMNEGLSALLGRVGAPQIPLGESESDYDALMEQIKERGMTYTEEQEQRRNELIEQLSELGIDVYRLQRNLERARARGKQARTELHSLQSTNEQLSRAIEEAKKIPKPQFKFGQRVFYPALNTEAEITDLDVQNGHWVYIIRTPDGNEYIARASEIEAITTAAPQAPKRLSVFQENKEELLNGYGAVLAGAGIEPSKAMQIAEQNAPELEREVSPAKTIEEALRIVDVVARRDLPRILSEQRARPQVAQPSVEITQGERPGEVEVRAGGFYGSTLEAKIEKERGFPLTPFEERLLKLPLFQQVERNSKYFSRPQDRERRGYPEKVEDLIKFYLGHGELSERQLRDVGLRPP